VMMSPLCIHMPQICLIVHTILDLGWYLSMMCRCACPVRSTAQYSLSQLKGEANTGWEG
jgi:hypothetical protein